MKVGFSKHLTHHLSPLDECEVIADFTVEEHNIWKQTEELYIALQNLLQIKLSEKKVIPKPRKKVVLTGVN